MIRFGSVQHSHVRQAQYRTVKIVPVASGNVFPEDFMAEPREIVSDFSDIICIYLLDNLLPDINLLKIDLFLDARPIQIWFC